MEFPHPRFNAQLTVQDDVLYIYGGTYEKGDREFTFDEMYALDLGKLDGVKQLFRREPENWFGSDDEDSEDDGSADDGEDGEDEDEEGDIKMADEKSLHSKSTRKRKETDVVEDASETASVATSTTFDDTPDNGTFVTGPDDNLPHPRPFESRRDFFKRTGNDWQGALMTSLRWKGTQPETLSVKEIKAKAFEMSEEKWWDCREEITALEDEQEAAGIGEVVTLSERGEAGEASEGSGRRR